MLVAFFLQGTKQEHLCLIGKVAYLVKKECPAVSLLKQSGLVTVSAGERALAVAEEFRCGKLFGNGSAIDRYIRLVLSAALFMHLPGYVLLACTGSPAKKDGYVGSRNQAYLAVHLPGLVTLSAVELIYIMFYTAENLANGLQQSVRLYGFAKVVCGTKLHGFHRILNLAVVGHYEEWDIQMLFMYPS